MFRVQGFLGVEGFMWIPGSEPWYDQNPYGLSTAWS